MIKSCLGFILLVVGLVFVSRADVPEERVVVDLYDDGRGGALALQFLGVSYEMSMLLPKHGEYYFDPQDQPLINTFRTLGIKSLRVGANAVDNPEISVPQTMDIDELFSFARAAGVKVIYSFRLKGGDPDNSARLAAYIKTHYADALDCFSIGNEPNFYLKTFSDYFPQWKRQYDAILEAVPTAMFDGPSVANAPPAAQNYYPLELARAVYPAGHLAMVSDHYYFLGRRNECESNAPAARARFLSNAVDANYGAAYAQIGAKLAGQRVPYRIDELNSCARGGAKDSSDTYASTLWALDCTHWWAAHHILGMNYHTGDFVGRGGQTAGNYAAFVHQADGHGVIMRPLAYALLAFAEGAHGRPLAAKVQLAPGCDFDAYAYRDGASIYLTLINKTYGDNARYASVSVALPASADLRWQRMDLVQEQQDVAAKTGVTLGGAPVGSLGTWPGRWGAMQLCNSNRLTVQVAPASAALLHLVQNNVVAKAGLTSEPPSGQ